ncbi:MAG: DNA polymerase III subunit delta' [Gammaproteobacteria bacterium]|nr:DNA polymerase III subunit delta' [Gammaproteobacteria bacterium]
MADIFPWHRQIFTQLAGQLEAGKLPHALLFSGNPGLGKLALAQQLAGTLLCSARLADGQPCGECPACAQLAAGSHPDFLYITLEEDATAIKVDQVRALAGALSMCAHGQGFKVAIIAPADLMNANAANSLLKTLEEPSDNTVLVLVSDRPSRLPATIRSRCQQVRFNAPDQALAMEWLSGHLANAQQARICLELAAGAPLAALELAADGVVEARRERLGQLVDILDGRATALDVAQAWSKDEGLQAIRWMRDWLMDMLRMRMTGQRQEIRNIDLADALDGLARKLDKRVMFEQVDRINRVLVSGAGSLNRQLMTEDILLAWAAGQ